MVVATKPRARKTAPKAAARSASIVPSLGEAGATGTPLFGRQVQPADYNADLQPPHSYAVFDKMRLGDGQVRAATAAVKLPILRAYWQVESASDRAEDRMIAETADNDLDSMAIPFIVFLRQALLMLDYGSIPFEQCWKIGDDGLVHIRKFAARLPASITEWQVDDGGELLAIKQSVMTPNGYAEPTIPANKLSVFVNDQEGANYRGTSILRAAYKHWYYKDHLYAIDAIAKEKRAVGIDVGTLKAGPDKAALKDPLERALMTLKNAEKQFFVEDEENYTYRLETGGASIADAMPSIEHHDLRILRSILVEMLAMGAGSTGSLAMHKDKSAFFLMTLEAIADFIAEELTRSFLRRWVDYNWIVKGNYPRFKYSRLDTRDFAAIAQAVATLVSAGALTPTPDTEAELRVVGDLPEKETPDALGFEPKQVEQVEEAAEPVAARQIQRMIDEVLRADNPRPAASIAVPFKRAMTAEIAAVWPGDTPDQGAIRAKMIADILGGRLKSALIAGVEAQSRLEMSDRDDLAGRMRAALDGAIAAAMRAAA